MVLAHWPGVCGGVCLMVCVQDQNMVCRMVWTGWALVSSYLLLDRLDSGVELCAGVVCVGGDKCVCSVMLWKYLSTYCKDTRTYPMQ